MYRTIPPRAAPASVSHRSRRGLASLSAQPGLRVSGETPRRSQAWRNRVGCTTACSMRPLVFIGIFVLAGCSKSKQEERGKQEERVYVSDEDGGNVIVISTASDSVVARIPVGKRPRGLRVSPDGTV